MADSFHNTIENNRGYSSKIVKENDDKICVILRYSALSALSALSAFSASESRYCDTNISNVKSEVKKVLKESKKIPFKKQI